LWPILFHKFEVAPDANGYQACSDKFFGFFTGESGKAVMA